MTVNVDSDGRVFLTRWLSTDGAGSGAMVQIELVDSEVRALRHGVEPLPTSGERSEVSRIINLIADRLEGERMSSGYGTRAWTNARQIAGWLRRQPEAQ